MSSVNNIVNVNDNDIGNYDHTPTVDCTLVTAFSKFLKKLAFTWPAGHVYDLFS